METAPETPGEGEEIKEGEVTPADNLADGEVDEREELEQTAD